MLSGQSTGLEKQRCGFESHLGQFTFSLKENEPFQLVLLCCLALFDEFRLHNHVHVEYTHMYTPALGTCHSLQGSEQKSVSILATVASPEGSAGTSSFPDSPLACTYMY